MPRAVEAAEYATEQNAVNHYFSIVFIWLICGI